jgi:hypothetical protein
MANKLYTPKRKSYPDLRTLSREMTQAKVKHEYNGAKIETKHQKFTMLDSQVLTKELESVQ